MTRHHPSRARRSLPAIVFAAVLILGFPAGAGAAGRGVSSSQLRDLAERGAEGDRAALSELRDVVEVDGVRVDLAPLIGDGRGRDERLRGLARQLRDPAPTGSRREAAAVRSDARSILRDRRFQAHPEPRPLRGLLRWIGARLRWIGRQLSPVFAPIGRVLRPLLEPLVDFAHTVPGAIAVAAMVAGGVAITLVRYARRRARGAVMRRRDERRLVRTDPAELERAAAVAEGQGDFALALRLLFQAGLIRLDRAGVIRLRPSSTAAEVARSLHDATLDTLTATYERVAYGRRPASADELAAAKADWPPLLATLGSRQNGHAQERGRDPVPAP